MKYILQTDNIKALCTYKRGKLCAVEVKKGTFDFEHLGELVPVLEKNISALFTPDTSQAKNPFHSPALEEWNRFYTQLAGVSYRFTAADGTALKQIGKYLHSLVDNDTDKALELWRHVLASWSRLDEFYRNNPDLKFINSQLNKIVFQLKNGKQGSHTAKRNDADDLRRSFTR